MLTGLQSGQNWFGSVNGERSSSSPLCPFSLSHHASYPVRTGFVFMSENNCQTLKLTAHLHPTPLSRMCGGIPLLHNMSWRYFF